MLLKVHRRRAVPELTGGRQSSAVRIDGETWAMSQIPVLNDASGLERSDRTEYGINQ